MLSIVIPTLQKNNEVLQLLLDELIECELIGEIIIIDNSLRGFDSESDKVRVIVPDVNLYVNPAWNLGISESKYEFVGVLNDDIIFPKNAFEQIHDFLVKNEIALLGLDSIKRTLKSEISNYPDDCEVKFCPIDVRDNCWGSAIFGKKNHFSKIPDDIKIWCGDDYLFKMNNGLKNYKLYNADIKHLHSNTSSLKEFDEIKKNDVRFYRKIDNDLFNNSFNFPEKFDLFVSLGSACSCTQILRTCSLQYYSYPFDWLYGSNFLDRIKILVNNFENWLNKEDLISYGCRAETHPNDIYKNIRTDIVFNHDFQIDTPLYESYPKVKEKYDRRIKRLLYQIENSNKLLFVYITRPDEREETLQEDLIEGYNLLKQRFPDVDIYILYLFCTREVDFKSRKVIKISDNITRISFDYDAYYKPHPYAVNGKVLECLFKQFKISMKYKSLKLILRGLKNQLYKFPGYIFSVRNEYKKGTKRKVIYLIGIKLKFKKSKGCRNEMAK